MTAELGPGPEGVQFLPSQGGPQLGEEVRRKVVGSGVKGRAHRLRQALNGVSLKEIQGLVVYKAAK